MLNVKYTQYSYLAICRNCVRSVIAYFVFTLLSSASKSAITLQTPTCLMVTFKIKICFRISIFLKYYMPRLLAYLYVAQYSYNTYLHLTGTASSLLRLDHRVDSVIESSLASKTMHLFI